MTQAGRRAPSEQGREADDQEIEESSSRGRVDFGLFATQQQVQRLDDRLFAFIESFTKESAEKYGRLDERLKSIDLGLKEIKSEHSSLLGKVDSTRMDVTSIKTWGKVLTVGATIAVVLIGAAFALFTWVWPHLTWNN